MVSNLLEILYTHLVSKVYEHLFRNGIREIYKFLTLALGSRNMW